MIRKRFDQIKYILLSIIIIALLLVMSSVISIVDYDTAVFDVRSNNGIIDLSESEFGDNKLYALKGDWDIYLNELYEPSDFIQSNISDKKIISVPKSLSNFKNEIKDDRVEYATLRMKIILNRDVEYYALRIRELGSSSKIWIDDELCSFRGVVGVNSLSATNLKPIEKVIDINKKEITITIQVSDYHGASLYISDILLASQEAVDNYTNKRIIEDALKFGSVLYIAIFYAVLFYFYKKESYYFYFSLIAFFTAIRGGAINEKIFTRLFDNINQEILGKLIYIMPYVLLPLVILCSIEIFKIDKLKFLNKYSKIFIIVSLIFILITDLNIYRTVFIYVTGLMFILSLVFLYIFAKYAQNSTKKHRIVLYVSIAFVYATGLSDYIYDVMYLENRETLTNGILVFLLIEAVYTAWRTNEMKKKQSEYICENNKMINEIKSLNKKLEERVKNKTKELIKANKKLENLVKLDPLTELGNRRFFNEKLISQWDKAKQNKRPISIIMIDIDDFKKYNDCFGHLKGDECLIKISNKLEKMLYYESFFVSRYGGEEFVVLLSDVGYNKSLEISEKIRKGVIELKLQKFKEKENEFVTISLGIDTVFPYYNNDVEKFIDNSDKALYEAKDRGKNQSVHAWDIERG